MLRRRDVKDARVERAQRERTWVTTKPGSPTPAIFREVSPAGLEPAIVAFVGRCLLQFGYGDKRANTLLAVLATCRCGENEGRSERRTLRGSRTHKPKPQGLNLLRLPVSPGERGLCCEGRVRTSNFSGNNRALCQLSYFARNGSSPTGDRTLSSGLKTQRPNQ